MKKYLYGGDENFIDLKIDIENKHLKILNLEEIDLNDCEVKFVDILKDDYDYIIKERALGNDGIVDLSDLPNGIYFYDIVIESKLILFNVNNSMFQVEDGNISLLERK